MTTPLDIILLALKDSGVIGVGQTASAEDTNDAFTRLNFMLAQWSRKRWLVYHLVTTAFTSTGAQTYTVGTGGDFNIARPDRLESAFLRQLSTGNNIDYPLSIIQSREMYNQIALKSLVSFPQYIFYDSGFPLGTLYPYAIPQATIYQIHITTKAELPAFTSLVQDVNLPPEYMAALYYNLCARLRPAYQLPPDPSIVALAKDSLNVVRGANAQIANLTMPRSLVRGGLYNIFNDQIY